MFCKREASKPARSCWNFGNATSISILNQINFSASGTFRRLYSAESSGGACRRNFRKRGILGVTWCEK
jgi:hypothetical protein